MDSKEKKNQKVDGVIAFFDSIRKMGMFRHPHF